MATFLGTLIGLAPLLGIAACAIWLVTFLISRISSLSALVAAAFAPITAVFLGYATASAVTFVMALIVFWAHRANLKRLRAGTEPRVSRKE